MRFRTDVVPVVLVVSATVVTMPVIEGCKKQDTTADASNVPIIIKRKEDIPPMPLGGAAVPYIPPPPSASAPASPSPAQGKAPAAGAAAAAPAVEPAAPAAPTALAITHNHPPDQPCNHPLKREEVEKALSDLQSKK